MSFWSTLLKYGGNAAHAGERAVSAGARSAGNVVVHPQRTLVGAGKAVKTAAAGGAVGYVAWEKLTTDKSVARIVGDAVIGEDATNSVVQAADDVRQLKEKAGDAVDAVTGAVSSADSKWNGISNFFKGIMGGNGGNMFGDFFGNIAKGNVSGLGIVGLIAAAFMLFGRFGWMGKIAGALLGMFIIGNNSRTERNVSTTGAASGLQQSETVPEESESRGMKR